MTTGALQKVNATDKPTATVTTTTTATSTPSSGGPTNTPRPTRANGDPTTTVTPPSGTLSLGATAVELLIHIPGLGKNGNTNPKHTTRPVTVTITDKDNKEVAEAIGTVTYSSSTGMFTGTVGLPADLRSGSYLIKVKTDNSITRIISSGFLALQKSKVNKLPEVTLPAVDLDKNNEISFSDITVYRQCISKKNCPESTYDLNDDGENNILDYNVFFEVFGNYQGE